MRVAIVTFHCSYNFGSALQAYALQTGIESLNHNATIIDYRSENFFSKYRLFPLRHPRRMLRSLICLPSNLRRKKSFESFWKSHFHLTDKTYSYKEEKKLPQLSEKYDCFVCGSDQIWNVDCTHGLVGPFFLTFVKGKRKVAFAPSLAHTSFRQEYYDEELLKGALSDFDFISIREKSTLPLVQRLTNKPVEIVRDPTLLLKAENYRCLSSDSGKETSPFIFVYVLRPCSELIESAKKIAATTGLTVRYVSETAMPIKNSVNMKGIGPKEFLSLIGDASLVLSNSFHATVFSTLFEKRFLSFAVDKSASRIQEYLAELGIDRCCATEICDVVPDDIDWVSVSEKINAMRARLYEQLAQALGSAEQVIVPQSD